MVKRGVEFVNWHTNVLFIHASDIGSFHQLHHLFATLTLEDLNVCCCWVTLSEDDWDNHCVAYYKCETQALPHKHNCKGPLMESAHHEALSDGSNEEGVEESRPRKKCGVASGKENNGVGLGGLSSTLNYISRHAGKGKVKVRVLAMVRRERARENL